ncbi:MAG: GHKL domain-containing protein [Flavobacteriales bacterium]|nr:GHKL domain-containing protein [Flavobacteriales bacterium]
MSAARISNILGEHEGYQAIFHDMTQIKEAQNDIRIAEKMAFTGRLAQLIAHEIRNPLSNIDLAVDQMRNIEELEKEDREVYFDIVKRNSTRINDLISQILDSSKPATLNVEVCRVKDLIAQVIDLTRDRSKLLKVDLQTEIQDESAEIQVDKEKLTVALVNIMTNAMEAMEATAKPKLVIAVLLTADRVIFSIEDNGKGMSPEQQKMIFEPFFTGRRGGKGLGMTLTHNVILAHHGTIDLESAEGKGTTFFISVPRRAAQS